MNFDTDIHTFYESMKIALSGKLPGYSSHKKVLPVNRSVKPTPADEELVRQAAILIQIFPDKNKQLSTLFIKRPEYNGVHAGQIAFPGGKKETTDTALTHTALREAEEEVAAPINKLKIAGTLSQIYIPPSKFQVLPVVGMYTEMPSFVADAHEVDALLMINLATLFAHNSLQNGVIKATNYTIKSPYFAINNQKIWGATAMVVSELKDIVLALSD